MSENPIEDHLDELLHRSRADARSTRRLLDEAGDHLHATAAELHRNGMSRVEAENEAVRRFGPVTPLVDSAHRRSLRTLTLETVRAAVFLASWGLISVGISGLVVLVMNLSAGRTFVGGRMVGQGRGVSVQETADDAVVLRVIAGFLGILLLFGYLAWRRHTGPTVLLPSGLVEALGAAAFAAGAVALTVVSVDQAVHTGTPGIGFPLSGALVALPASAYFCVRTTRALLSSRIQVAD